MVTNEFIALRALRAGAKIIRDTFGRYKLYHRTTAAEISEALVLGLQDQRLIQKAERKPEHVVEMWEIAPAQASG